MPPRTLETSIFVVGAAAAGAEVIVVVVYVSVVLAEMGVPGGRGDGVVMLIEPAAAGFHPRWGQRFGRVEFRDRRRSSAFAVVVFVVAVVVLPSYWSLQL